MTEPALYATLLRVCFGASAVTILSTLFITAPYGRHSRGGWGPMIGGTAGWLIMETPTVVVPTACFVLGRTPHGAVDVVFLLVWYAHYLHRTFVYPLRRTASAKPMPFVIALLGASFNVLNGYLNGRWLFAFGPLRDASWFLDPRFIVGIAVFAVGMAMNLHSDEILLHLRKPGERGYVIPRGGMFRWVTSPNYLGEIIEWAGFALLTWSPAALGFALYTAANIGPRAISHHRWYRETFADYPKERRALLPFVL